MTKKLYSKTYFVKYTLYKQKFSIMHCFSKYVQIRRKLTKSLIENFLFCAVTSLLENQIPVVILAIWLFINRNKNTLTGPVNCKKTTRHHAHLSLCAKSRKTNDAKLRKWPKTSIWATFGQFWDQISPNCKCFWKIDFIQIEGHI